MTRFKKVVRMRKRLQTVLVPYWGDMNDQGSIDYGYERRFELIDEEEKEMKKFTRSDLRDGDVVQYRSGDIRIVKGGSIYNNSTFMNNLDNYDQNLKTTAGDHLDIVKVYRSIWEREELTITSVEKVLLENIDSSFKYIARDKSASLYVYEEKPEKANGVWVTTFCVGLRSFNNLFPVVKWEDEEPWLIKDLLNLPVKDDK